VDYRSQRSSFEDFLGGDDQVGTPVSVMAITTRGRIQKIAGRARRHPLSKFHNGSMRAVAQPRQVAGGARLSKK
jgi:hypothetical protein